MISQCECITRTYILNTPEDIKDRLCDNPFKYLLPNMRDEG